MCKRVLFSVLVLFSLMLLSINACHHVSPQINSTYPLQNIESENIELIFNITYPQDSIESKVLTEWANKFTEISGGQVKFKIFYNSSLIPSSVIIPNILEGSADISNYIPYNTKGMELNRIFELPLLGCPSPEKGTIIIRRLFDEFPELMTEYRGLKVKYLTMWGETTTYLNTTQKLIKTQSDMQGLVFSIMPSYEEWFEIMGAKTIFIPLEDTSNYLKKGVLDGYCGPLYNTALGSLELTPYHTDIGSQLFLIYNPIVINPDTWDLLPTNIQKIFDNLEPFFTDLMLDTIHQAEIEVLQTCQQNGHTFYAIPLQETQIWIENAKISHETWIQETEAVGKPARLIYNELNRLIEEYNDN
ncbi:MAG: TRAP transporter substrate-binding protein DctP [Dehalococcoidales bacterium]|nr:TRAP transporter substrate-binding protein DctP [Dehalococcoidales bacterium]